MFNFMLYLFLIMIHHIIRLKDSYPIYLSLFLIMYQKSNYLFLFDRNYIFLFFLTQINNIFNKYILIICLIYYYIRLFLCNPSLFIISIHLIIYLLIFIILILNLFLCFYPYIIKILKNNKIIFKKIVIIYDIIIKSQKR